MRPADLKTGAVPNAAGSALYQVGQTKVLAAVYGPRQEGDRTRAQGTFLVDVQFGPYTSDGECPERRALYNSLLQGALESVALLDRYQRMAFDVHIFVIEDDGGVLASALTAASLALINAQVEVRDIVAGATVHLAKGSAGSRYQLLLDCCADEERSLAEGSAVLHFGFCAHSGRVCLFHAAGTMPPEELESAVHLGRLAAQAVGAQLRGHLDRQLQHRAARELKRLKKLQPEEAVVAEAEGEDATIPPADEQGEEGAEDEEMLPADIYAALSPDVPLPIDD